ncbi:MAG: hypothetical protein IIU18_01280 [Oscillospiraceae bacterium]|nr:hypothetical protein [Oscillospiraceae bacterium]
MTQELLDCLQGETASPAAPCGGSASETEEAGSASIPAQAQGASPAGEAGRPAAAPGGGGAEEGNPLPAEADRAEKAEKGFDAEGLRGHLAGLYAQAAGLQGFDLRNALRDPAFVRLTAPGTGVSVEDAWFALHRREAQQMREEENRRLLSRAAAASARRPREGGHGSPALLASDYRSLSREEQLRVKRRIFEAGARGEKIYP